MYVCAIVDQSLPTKLGYLLSQQFHSLDRVTEDDALVDLELGEERVQTVDFLSLLNVSVVLGDALQCQLIHQVDGVWVLEVPLLVNYNMQCAVFNVALITMYTYKSLPCCALIRTVFVYILAN